MKDPVGRDVIFHCQASVGRNYPQNAHWTLRFFCLVFLVGWAILLSAWLVTDLYITNLKFHAAYPVGGCRTLGEILDCLYPIVLPSTSLLFFHRVCAIYGGARTVTVVFGFLWIAELAACISVPISTKATNIGPTRYCIIAQLAPYAGAASIISTVFDTAVFIAISYKLVGNALVDYSWPNKVRAFFRGAYLPSFSKSLLVDGQMYYMFTVVTNITTSVMIYAPVSPLYRSIPAVPNLMLNTLMACRVYRHTRLMLVQESRSVAVENVGTGARTTTIHFGYPVPQRANADSEIKDAGIPLEPIRRSSLMDDNSDQSRP
ncbi:hypothetical protein MVEN_00869100 [Mycena venus]|uniref:Uncharacterized protein n=1 Tax=Mycena venus TaxID=2733690 RepID=A0A8H6YH53_9AGAR|nr:hypothetical protein MVEN_00869100 [Mycena venus]